MRCLLVVLVSVLFGTPKVQGKDKPGSGAAVHVSVRHTTTMVPAGHLPLCLGAFYTAFTLQNEMLHVVGEHTGMKLSCIKPTSKVSVYL